MYEVHEMAVPNGHKVSFICGDARYITLLDGKRIKDFTELSEPLGVTNIEIARFVGGYKTMDNTDSNTQFIHTMLICLCGFANTNFSAREAG